MKNGSYLVRILTAVLGLVPIAGSPALAQIFVIESTAPDIKVGAQLAASDSVSIPGGAMIRAILPSGKTQTLKGPYSGSVANLAKGQAVNDGVTNWLKDIVQTGGATESTSGATRSLGAARSQPRFSWSSVPASVDGAVCIEKGAKLGVARAPVPVVQRLSVVDTVTAARGETQWEVNAGIAPWPADVAVREGGTYYLFVEGRPRRQVTLHVVDGLPAEDDLLIELQKRGCRYQFDAFVREKLRSPKR
jgi:hypothetical protein